MSTTPRAPLSDLRVVVVASRAAAAYAGRLLATLGADTLLIEPPGGTPLRYEPPFLDSDGRVSALFAYLAAGMGSTVADPETPEGREAVSELLASAHIFLDDTPIEDRAARHLDAHSIATAHPHLVHVSVLPFGAHGPKSGWKAEEINLQHASGEGNLLPNGLSVELFPDRPPVSIYGHFAELQGGIAAAMGALAALSVRDELGGQFVDISCQDAALAVGAFAIQRHGDGAIEHRVSRSFRYGGVIPCADGHVELLTLEQHQWEALVELLGRPQWALDPALADSLERGRKGPAINAHIREWARTRPVAEIVTAGQAAGVPIARYNTPADVLNDAHERIRGLFAPVDTGAGQLDMLVSPFHFDGEPLSLRSGPPALGESLPQPAQTEPAPIEPA